MNNERKQVLAIKQLLVDSLGGMANDYWNSLTDYFNCKITKPQLDTILLYMTPEQQQLHNKLMLNIMTNSQQNFSVKAEEDVGIVFKPSNRRNHKHFQTRFNAKTVQSLTKEHKQQLLSLNAIPEGDENDLFKDVLQDPKSIEGIPNTCIEEGDLPTLDALYSRINFISAFQELDSSKDVVDLMNQALENIITNCLDKNQRGVKNDEESRLSVQELLFAFQMNPQQVNPNVIEAMMLL